MKSVQFIQRNTQGHWVGDGFPVRTLFSYNDDPAAFSPFLMLDYGGPVVFEPTRNAAAWARTRTAVSKP